MMRMKRLLAIAGVVGLIATAMLPAAAIAQSSVEGYGGPSVVAGLEEGGGNGGPPPSAPVERGGAPSLPFTGTDLGVLVSAGGILLALGFGLRRLTHRPFQA
jgi:hypothetical protein